MQASSVTLNGGTLDGAGATLVVDPFVGIGSLEIMAGNVTGSPSLSVGGSGPVKGQVTLSSNTPLVVDVSSLSVDQAASGKVDLGLGRINIASGNAIDLLADLLSGRAGGSWNGTGGITSSAAAASGGTRTVGWIDNGGSLSVAFAAPGDTNLDWTVDVNDAANLLTAGKYDNGLAATWNEGDFNYDGVVDIQDAAEFTTTGLYNAGVYNPPSVSGAVAAVPEPSSAGIAFGMAGLMLAWRLRRRAA
jgi:MYXO-CTERM domain-containing protein